jgi:hypothetical protein
MPEDGVVRSLKIDYFKDQGLGAEVVVVAELTSSSIFPMGYALMPGMIPRKGKIEVRSLDLRCPWRRGSQHTGC